MSTYTVFLYIHSWLRWIILLLGIIAIIKAYAGWLGKKPFSKGDNAISGSFMGSLHLNLLIGLILYLFLSPYGLEAFDRGVGEVMKDAYYRFWAVEHIVVNIIAVVVAQIGRTKSKKALDPIKKHKLAAIFYSVAFILLISRIPWGEAARLFRI